MERIKLKSSSKKEKESTTKRKIIIAVILIISAFSGSFLIYFIMQISLDTKVPMVVVISPSMEPKINVGDLLFVKGKDPEDIKNGTIEGKEGDIIVFDAHGIWSNPPADPVVHRVVGKRYDNGWLFTTKGDANTFPDSAEVPANKIFGVVCGRIPYIGWIKILLTNSGLLIPLLIIISIILVISIIWDIIKKEEEEKDINEKKNIYDETKTKTEIEIDFTKQKQNL
ncbi:MAG: signal peptidase I [Promethearchaeota archaeon]